MQGKEIRKKFLDFFEGKGHRILPSASLIPENDPSILWTAAGMVPFKPYFTGTATPPVKRVTTCQKCLRTPDIEEVGRTARHHTFFEMLGNFSFGDYFKEQAIPWAWEFVTQVLGLDPASLWITIYLDDDEAYDIWHRTVGVSADRIVRMGKDTNYWEIGVGPCGPCSEIYVDLGQDRSCGPDCAVGCDCDRFLEIWNLVFIQFFRDEQGNYTPLTTKGIDTGMGLERVASVLQGVSSNFDTDLFREIMDYTAAELGLRYGANADTDVALKVIADHGRAVTFAIADGAFPGNEGRDYVVRRLARRAIRYGRLLGRRTPFLHLVAGAVITQMGEAYPELYKRRDYVLEVIGNEEKRFSETLAQGTEILEKIMEEGRIRNNMVLSGSDTFKLYDTYGFPLELTREMAGEKGFTLDEDGFAAQLSGQRERSRGARDRTVYLSERQDRYRRLQERIGDTVFTGYETLNGAARVLSLLRDGEEVGSASVGEEIEFVLDTTPCYAESGGQVSDLASVEGPGVSVAVTGAYRPVENFIVHRGKVESGTLRVDDLITIQVDARRRRNTARNHTATHLLHRALRDSLGEHVRQAGSLVEPNRLRFDFVHNAQLSGEQLAAIQSTVNRVLLDNLPVVTVETTVEEARALGAQALFGEKYGERVRLVRVGDYSMELCGGTHLGSTAEVGVFKLIAESSVASGVRRIEAATGEGALRLWEAEETALVRLAGLLSTRPQDVPNRVEAVLESVRELEKESESLRATLARCEVDDLVAGAREMDGVKVLSARVAARDMDGLRAMGDLLRDRLPGAVIVLGSVAGERVNMVALVSPEVVKRGVQANKLIKEAATLLKGSGGGRPEMAQAGGRDPAHLPEALALVYEIVGRFLAAGTSNS